MEFDEEKLAPTFRLLWGIPGRSNAINTAERIGLEPAIVAAARDRLGSTLVRLLGPVQGPCSVQALWCQCIQ